jgi:ParB family chromosome partitioning protein
MKTINIESLEPHPDNPRTDLGDLTELAASIKERGILQNLTVVPMNENFRVVIGHRRLAAAKLAGIEELPCIVVEMDDKEQLSTMLLENMQRSDLTVVEQAQGFQMMLDLGSTEDEISEKTGFSRSTVHHRVELARLKPELLKKRQNDEDFQMSLKDLYELEKIDDIKVRNRILKDTYSSNRLKYEVNQYIREAQEEKNYKAMVAILKKLGLKKAPENMQGYYKGVTQLLNHDLSDTPLKKFNLGDADPTKCYYQKGYGSLRILINTKDLPKTMVKESKYDLEVKAQNKRRKALKKIEKQMKFKWIELIKTVIDEKLEPEGCTKEDIIRGCLLAALSGGGFAYITSGSLAGLYYGKESYETDDNEKKSIINMDTEHIALLFCFSAVRDVNAFDYRLTPEKKFNIAAANICEALSHYGYVPDDEERQLLDGSHELYRKEE